MEAESEALPAAASEVPTRALQELTMRDAAERQYRARNAFNNQLGGLGGALMGTAVPTGYYRCDINQHYFECRHAALCECGTAHRTPPASLEVEKGL